MSESKPTRAGDPPRIEDMPVPIDDRPDWLRSIEELEGFLTPPPDGYTITQNLLLQSIIEGIRDIHYRLRAHDA